MDIDIRTLYTIPKVPSPNFILEWKSLVAIRNSWNVNKVGLTSYWINPAKSYIILGI